MPEHHKPGAIFIAYAHGDRDRALPVVKAFRRRAVVAVLDNAALPGAVIGDQINLLIERCQLLVLLWSRTAVASAWVLAEIRAFQKFHPDARVLPLLLDDTPLPVDLVQFQAIALRGTISEIDSIARDIAGRIAPGYLQRDAQKIFISYSRADSAALEKCADSIRRCGFEAVIDREFVESDATFAADIVEQLEICRAFFFLSSSNSNNSRHCRREIHLADGFKLPLLWTKLDENQLHKECRYFFAATRPWKEVGTVGRLLGRSFCSYMANQIAAQSE